MTYTTIWMDRADQYSSTDREAIDSLLVRGLWDESSGTEASSDHGTQSVSGAGFSFHHQNPALDKFRRSTEGDRICVTLMFRYKSQGLPVLLSTQHTVAAFYNAFNLPIAYMQITPTGRVILRSYDDTVLATSTREVAAGVWNHYEMKLNLGFGGSSNTLSVRVNGKSAFTVSATDAFLSKADPNATPLHWAIAEVYFGARTSSGDPMTSGYSRWDDIAVLEYQDAEVADYLGLYGVYYLKAVSDGDYNDFSLSEGSDAHALIDEIPPDGDATFIFTDTNGDKESFNVEALPVTVVAVQSVMPVIYGRKTDAGTGSIQLGVLSSGDEAENGDDIPLLTDYSYQVAAFDVDPHSSGDWDPAHMPQILVERTV